MYWSNWSELLLAYQKADNKIFICKFSKNVKSELNHIENSKTRGQNSVDQDEVANYEPPHQGSTLFTNSTIFILKELMKMSKSKATS